MTDIASIGPAFSQAQPGPVARVERPAEQVRAVARAQTTGRMVGDQIELSDQARLLARMHELPEIRRDLVDRARAEIASGTYETPEKLQMAVGRLIDDLADA